jgi:hypothetical protein
MTGDPVASKRSIVSRIASSKSGAKAGLELPFFLIASINASGRGMLPIGSVGIIINFC